MNEEIVKYIRDHQGAFTRAALRDNLQRAGYAADEIDEALDAETAASAPEPVLGRDLRLRAGTVVAVAYIGTFIAFNASNLPYVYLGDAWLQALGIMLTIAGLLSVGIVAQSKKLARGDSGALVATLALPFVLLVLVSGLCIPGAVGDRYN